MHLYERITFILLAGTFGLFFLAIVLGAFGVIFALYPEFDRALRARLSLVLTMAHTLYHELGERTVLLYKNTLRSRQTLHS
ncbi:MAG: hypothetical protein JWM39_577 [Parcubacteria group bacterium]|nr:hypothetical protein [Parcubacteria group bacterium]